MTNPLCERGSASGRRAWPALALLLFGCNLGLPGCGKEAPGEAPPQTGKPAEPAPPPAPEPKPAEEHSGSPSMLEKDRAADEAPAASQFAPPPPPASSATPDDKARRRAAPSKASGAARGGTPRSDLPEAPLGPQLLRQRLADVVKQSTPDCPSARDRKQAICDLASQICQLVDRDPDVASVESYCDDAKQRCSDAERRTAQRCK